MINPSGDIFKIIPCALFIVIIPCALFIVTPVRLFLVLFSSFTTARPGPGTGHRPVTGFWFFVKIPSVTMTDSEPEDDGSEEGSRHACQSLV